MRSVVRRRTGQNPALMIHLPGIVVYCSLSESIQNPTTQKHNDPKPVAGPKDEQRNFCYTKSSRLHSDALCNLIADSLNLDSKIINNAIKNLNGLIKHKPRIGVLLDYDRESGDKNAQSLFPNPDILTSEDAVDQGKLINSASDSGGNSGRGALDKDAKGELEQW